jgi:hypothetical protein
MTFNIAKLFRITITTLAIFPLALTLNLASARAENPSGINDIKDIAEAIAHHNPLAPTAEAPAETTEAEVSAERQQAIQYTVKGIEAENAGDREVALEQYGKAVEADATFGYPYLFSGQLIGESEIGIQLAGFAAKLFSEQNDKTGYDLAILLLKTFHVDL